MNSNLMVISLFEFKDEIIEECKSYFNGEFITPSTSPKSFVINDISKTKDQRFNSCKTEPFTDKRFIQKNILF